MSQNTSPAVMQQRQDARDALDDFPTVPWATRALFHHVVARQVPLSVVSEQVIHEPACNRGFMARPLAEYCQRVLATDVHDYGYSSMDCRLDFLIENVKSDNPPDWVVTNPPFVLGAEFILRCLQLGIRNFAMFVRSAFLEGAARYYTIFQNTPPTFVAQFVERVALFKGCVRDPNKKYWDDNAQKWKTPTTATAYSWLVWVDGVPPQPPVWIPPCRRQLERAGDYEANLS